MEGDARTLLLRYEGGGSIFLVKTFLAGEKRGELTTQTHRDWNITLFVFSQKHTHDVHLGHTSDARPKGLCLGETRSPGEPE